VITTQEEAECLYTEDEINLTLDRLAEALRHRLENTNPVLLCVMNGALIFAAQLAIRLTFPMQIDSLHISRYRDTTEGGDIQWHKEPKIPLTNRSVLVVDDILDEGHTLASIIEYCRLQRAREVLSVVLVEKIHERKLPAVTADFVGLPVDNRYVFGFGMDYKNYLRNLPGIYAISES
jgi:hypoxanthine phosphoribosyltransferase